MGVAPTPSDDINGRPFCLCLGLANSANQTASRHLNFAQRLLWPSWMLYRNNKARRAPRSAVAARRRSFNRKPDVAPRLRVPQKFRDAIKIAEGIDRVPRFLAASLPKL